MPPAWKTLADDMRRSRQMGPTDVPNMGGVQQARRRPRNFVAPPADVPAPGQFRGRPTGTMARSRDFQYDPQRPTTPPPSPPNAPNPPVRYGGVKPAPPNATGQPTPTGPPPGTGGFKSSIRVPQQWVPQVDPMVVRRAKFGEFFNGGPGAPQPELDPNGNDFNPLTGRWVR